MWLAPEPCRQLGAGVDAELLVSARQSAFDCVLCDEKGGCDFSIRAAFGDERRDSALGLGELAP